ncbi:MAG: packaged DNA stabilization gp4 family protein [Nitrosomonadaceae bacterium]
MASGADMVNGALRLIGVKPSDATVTGQEMLDGIEVLNDMLIEFENSGITLGFSPIADPADTIRVPRGTESAIKGNLAGRLAPEYGKQITPTLAVAISTATDSMLRIVSKPIDTKLPDSLPLGSGNQCTDFEDQRFFPENESENF